MPGRFFQKIKNGLKKTQARIRDQLVLTFTGRLIDDAFWDEVTDLLISADINIELAEAVTAATRTETEARLISRPANVMPVLAEVITARLSYPDTTSPPPEPPRVVFFVGVNGTGKTTSIAKVAHHLITGGDRVLLCAADTFRAAAREQLKVWADRVGAPVIAHRQGADPAAVLFDALGAAQARKVDWLLVDTAGRLHTRSNLMRELEKMGRVAAREVPGAPHDTFLVLDATTGQNALQQARLFTAAIPVTGLILTKLDGTARGGAVLAIVDHLKIPVRYLGVGEQLNDLVPFNPADFARALIGDPADLEADV